MRVPTPSPEPISPPAARKTARLALAAAAALGAAALGAPGCALYDDQWTGDCLLDCQPPVEEPTCAAPSSCGENQTCGEDGQCHSGNCRFWGCIAGYACVITDRGTAECEAGDGGATTGQGGAGEGGAGGGPGGQGGAGGSGGATTGQGGGAQVVFCGNPDDCDPGQTCGEDGACAPGTCDDVPCVEGFVCGARGACEHQNAAGCGEDIDCGGLGEGARCVSGLCTAPENLCFDRVQCPSGSACADGVCTPSCAEDGRCPEGWECDEPRGICSVPADPCERTADCGASDRVCVAGACVARADGATCPIGQVWVENGCLPEQRATFACTTDGEQAECAVGLLCVHRTCFVSCAPPDQDACAAIPGVEVCTDVTTETASYLVCGSEENLGGACDPTLGTACDAGLVCVDGTCR